MSEMEYKFVKMHDGAGLGLKEGEFIHQVELEANGWIVYIVGPANEDYSDFEPGFDIREAEITIGRTNLWSILTNPTAWDVKILKVGDEKDDIKVLDNSGHIRSIDQLERNIENEDFLEMRKMLFGLDTAIRTEFPGYCIMNRTH